ncbi:MAG: imidazole glycerol phosphate synthase subunit HisH [Anaerolineales bacterium]|nr:imidazole glycerol phosphate synthase subunit HisH [Anaerolineales bacterium]
MIVIVDYGVGNLGSIKNMFKKIGYKAEPSSNPEVLRQAEKLILPGVGAFDAGMSKLRERGLINLLNELVLEKKMPVLGHCLGMQLMTKKSEEGTETGLGWVEAESIRFKFESDQSYLKIPHMGWNGIDVQRQHAIVSGLETDSRFYFVHTYHVVCKNESDVVAYTDYGYNFASVIQKENIIGAQFHPEKSHKFGMQFLRNFAEGK